MILPPATLGVLGGGQLGRFFVMAAHEMGYRVMVLDPDEKVRGAHLGLIDGVLRGFSGIADFSEIVTG